MQADKRRGTIPISQSKGPPQQLYHPHLHILIIGDGDLTFSRALSNWFNFKYGAQHSIKIVATTYDSYQTLTKLYKHSIDQTISILKKTGVKVIHNIDVTLLKQLKQQIDPQNQKFDRIIWNFPHAGFPEKNEGPGFQWEHDSIQQHTTLLSQFFTQSQLYLKQNGYIMATHKSIPPYNEWKIDQIGQSMGLILWKQFQFREQDYPGYMCRRGVGRNGGKRFPCNDAIIYVFMNQQ